MKNARSVLVIWCQIWCCLSLAACFGARQAHAQNFTPTGSFAVPAPALQPMLAARSDHTATLLPNGRVLVAGSQTCEVFNPATGAWSTTGSMISSRPGHTATLLNNGKVLVTGGHTGGTAYLDSCELYDPATGTWSATGQMSDKRTDHTATLLPDGRVLVAGGFNGTYLSRCELYDPATGFWTASGSMDWRRHNHTATLWTNGKVLVASGEWTDNSWLEFCEFFDPATGTWSAAGDMEIGREQAQAIRLNDGRIIMTGGFNLSDQINSCELFGGTGTWSPTASMTIGRYGHTATLLADGRVLVAGARNGQVPSFYPNHAIGSSELYDPATDAWRETGTLVTPRFNHTATRLPNGKVLIAGGEGQAGTLSSCELYDPATGTFQSSVQAPERHSHVAVMLANGKILVTGGRAGGLTLASCQLYDPATGAWSTTASMTIARYHHAAALLPDGRVLVAGGEYGSALRTCEIYNPTSGAWTTTDNMDDARWGHTLSLLGNGKVLVVGGRSSSQSSLSGELYDPAAGTWRTITNNRPDPRNNHTATLLPNGRVLIAGGQGVNQGCDLYDPQQDFFFEAGSMARTRYDHTATLLPNGKVLIAGGVENGTGVLATCEVYDPATNTWSGAPDMPVARTGYAAVLLQNGHVLVTGGTDANGYRQDSALFDPVHGIWATMGNMVEARALYSLTALPSGQALVAGGANDSGALQSAELFNPPPAISIAAASANESAQIVFSVTLAANAKLDTTVDYTAIVGTAKVADFGAAFDSDGDTPGTLTIPTGQRTGTITVPILDDALDEDNETLTLRLSHPANTVFNTDEAIGTIIDDDAMPTVSLNNIFILETAGRTNFVAKLSAVSGRTVTAKYKTESGTATGGKDYSSTSSTVTFAPGETQENVFIGLRDDTLYEGDETFQITLNTPINAVIGASGTCTIRDNEEAPTLAIGDATVTEGNAPGEVSALFTVTLSAAQGQEVSFDYTTSAGTAKAPADYNETSGTITFAIGETAKTITVPIAGDTLDEPDETFSLVFTDVSHAVIADGEGVATIVDDEALPSLNIGDVTIAEGNSGTQNAVFTVTLSAPSTFTVSVNAVTANGMAKTPADYTGNSATLTFDPGQISKTFSVPVVGDLLDEENETFFVLLSSATNARVVRGRGIGTITDNDAAPTITIEDVSIGEGHSGQRTAVFRLHLSQASGKAIRVNYATAAGNTNSATAGNDYVAVGSTQITFNVGQTVTLARVLINGDLLNEPNETFLVNLSAPLNGTIVDSQAVGTILNDDSAPGLSINDVSISEGNPAQGAPGTKQLTFTVSLSKASGQIITVNYATADGIARSTSDYVTQNGTLTFAPGSARTRTISIIINGDLAVENNETLFVFLSGQTNASVSKARGTGTITNDDTSG